MTKWPIRITKSILDSAEKLLNGGMEFNLCADFLGVNRYKLKRRLCLQKRNKKYFLQSLHK